MSQFVDFMTVAKDHREVTTERGNSRATQLFQAPLLDEENSFSFCLLTKDDNAIMNEWIAYHYHVLRLRHIIVALDPKSETSPKKLLEAWKQSFGLNYTIWGDKDYMPEYFMQGQYNKVPKWLGKSDMEKVNAAKRRNRTEAQELYYELNNHCFRQATFFKHCARNVQDTPGRKWMAHIDTDEYLVVNPLSWEKDETNEALSISTLDNQVTTETISRPNYLVDLLIRWSQTQVGKKVLPCLMMHRLFYGSIEETSQSARHASWERLDQNSDKVVFLPDSMETIRWKYHANYTDEKRNKRPKVIMDVSQFPQFNTSIPFNSIHRPDRGLCLWPYTQDVYKIQTYPITANHYLGSWERYSSRADAHRTKAIYDEKANVQDVHQDDWIDVWLDGFVREHGAEKVARVLGHYMDLNQTRTMTITKSRMH